MSNLIITDVAIRQDSQNRYCHKAAGNEKKHQPANWLRANQTKALIQEIALFSKTKTNHSSEMRTAVNVINGGDNRGTYVVKELVYSYAMWVSAMFHLHVIHAYDTLISGEIPEHIIKAYDELVTNKALEDLKVITEPMSIFEFEARYAFHENALENLKNVQIIISAKEFLALKADKNV